MVKEDLIPRTWKNITKADSDLTDGVAVAIYVGTTGDVSVIDAQGNTSTFTAVPAGVILPGQFKRICSTGTTASNLSVAWS